jgi:hypothetical protein
MTWPRPPSCLVLQVFHKYHSCKAVLLKKTIHMSCGALCLGAHGGHLAAEKGPNCLKFKVAWPAMLIRSSLPTKGSRVMFLRPCMIINGFAYHLSTYKIMAFLCTSRPGRLINLVGKSCIESHGWEHVIHQMLMCVVVPWCRQLF